MKSMILSALCSLCFLSVQAEGFEKATIPQESWVIRVNSGLAFANRVGTGESAWYSNPEESSSGLQYGIDLLRYKKNLGYGLTFRHYMHHLSYAGSGNTPLLDENTRIFYVAPQFSNIEKDFLFTGLISNIDLGIGYAHYLSDGTINGTQPYSTPSSGLGVNLNLGFEYKFDSHWGAKLSISGEYYYFKNLHKGKTYSGAFDKRSKLNMLMLVPQIGFAYYL